MMVNKLKRKGDSLEMLAVRLLNEHVKKANFTRIPGSGQFGTKLDISGLTADVKGVVKSLPREIKIECKSGYSKTTDTEAKQLTLKKEWLDKIAEEAYVDRALPVMIGKFDNVRSGVKVFTVLDLAEFIWILNYITELSEELDALYKEREKLLKLGQPSGETNSSNG